MGHKHNHEEEHTHAHAHSHSHAIDRNANKKVLWAILALTCAWMIVEIIGGLWSGSLALLADAAHMFSDNVSIAIALMAMHLAARRATAKHSFGLKRAEILAALLNGVLLIVAAVWICVEAIGRFSNPESVIGSGMLIIGAIGLLVNIVAAVILSKSQAHQHNVNMKAVLQHLIADMLGSAGVILAAVIIIFTGYELADPIISLVIALLVALSAYGVLKETVSILLEGTPGHLDSDLIRNKIMAIEGVNKVHDLHIWTITSDFQALSAHIIVQQGLDCQLKRQEIAKMLDDEFHLTHSTLQVEYKNDECAKELDDCHPH